MFYVLKCCFPRFEEHLAYNNSQSAYSKVWAQAEWLGRRYQFVQYTGEHLLVSFCVLRKLFNSFCLTQIIIWGNNFETRKKMPLCVCAFLLHYLNSVAHTLSPMQVAVYDLMAEQVTTQKVLFWEYFWKATSTTSTMVCVPSWIVQLIPAFTWHWNCTISSIIGSPWHQFNFLFPFS